VTFEPTFINDIRIANICSLVGDEVRVKRWSDDNSQTVWCVNTRLLKS